jgi:hypothetical protein
MTSGVPKKSWTRGQAARILMRRFPARKRTVLAHRSRLPEPSPGNGPKRLSGTFQPLGATDE